MADCGASRFKRACTVYRTLTIHFQQNTCRVISGQLSSSRAQRRPSRLTKRPDGAHVTAGATPAPVAAHLRRTGAAPCSDLTGKQRVEVWSRDSPPPPSVGATTGGEAFGATLRAPGVVLAWPRRAREGRQSGVKVLPTASANRVARTSHGRALRPELVQEGRTPVSRASRAARLAACGAGRVSEERCGGGCARSAAP